MTHACCHPRNGEKKKRDVLGEVNGLQNAAELKPFAARHLRLKAQSGRVTDQWLVVSEQQLRTAVEFFGETRELHTIGVPDV